jgi:hypothetical protein
MLLDENKLNSLFELFLQTESEYRQAKRALDEFEAHTPRPEHKTQYSSIQEYNEVQGEIEAYNLRVEALAAVARDAWWKFYQDAAEPLTQVLCVDIWFKYEEYAFSAVYYCGKRVIICRLWAEGLPSPESCKEDNDDVYRQFAGHW